MLPPMNSENVITLRYRWRLLARARLQKPSSRSRVSAWTEAVSELVLDSPITRGVGPLRINDRYGTLGVVCSARICLSHSSANSSNATFGSAVGNRLRQASRTLGATMKRAYLHSQVLAVKRNAHGVIKYM
jgi:hypothetical protein